MKKPHKGERCCNDRKIVTVPSVPLSPGQFNAARTPTRVRFESCASPAVTVREDFRFGDTTKGEPLVVPLRVPLCAACADAWDDNEAEGRAEAAGS